MKYEDWCRPLPHRDPREFYGLRPVLELDTDKLLPSVSKWQRLIKAITARYEKAGTGR